MVVDRSNCGITSIRQTFALFRDRCGGDLICYSRTSTYCVPGAVAIHR